MFSPYTAWFLVLSTIFFVLGHELFLKDHTLDDSDVKFLDDGKQDADLILLMFY